MNYAPIARIIIRYAVGLVIGADAADIAAGDPDVITIVAAGIGAAVEVIYSLAKKRGWAT
uniref:hypothetical protein n=1 Tax=Yoonia sp. TaxID=2212373 RepID=UPI0040481967